MLSFTGSLRVMVALAPCDMRRGFDGLVGLVAGQLEENVKSGTLFVFTNRSRTRLKVLYWDGSGLWLMAKRLEQGRFAWPQASEQGQVKLNLSPTAFAMLSDGIELRKGSRRPWYEEPPAPCPAPGPISAPSPAVAS
jgi:transposase